MKAVKKWPVENYECKLSKIMKSNNIQYTTFAISDFHWNFLEIDNFIQDVIIVWGM